MAYSMERLKEIADYAESHNLKQTSEYMKCSFATARKACKIFEVSPCKKRRTDMSDHYIKIAQQLREECLSIEEIAEKLEVNASTIERNTTTPKRMSVCTLEDKFLAGETVNDRYKLTVNGVIIGEFIPIGDTIKPH